MKRIPIPRNAFVKKIFQFLWGWNKSGVQVLITGELPYFQFLWGWNKDSTSLSYYVTVIKPFNSFEDETVKLAVEAHMERQLISFNSFEDETPRAMSTATAYWFFQFLWGWNLITKRGMIKVFDFQFLWGWNLSALLYILGQYITFNSFEDETNM